MGIDANTGRAAFIAGNATVLGDVTLGDGVSVWFGAVVRADKDRVEVGARSNIQDNAVVHTTTNFPVIMGEDVSVGHGAILHGCTIRDRVLVGMGAIVLNGAVVGEDSVLGAGTVVTEKAVIPPGSVVIGVPGKVVKQASEDQKRHIVQNAKAYRELAERYRHG
ncbi:carbonic anhydrase/acetyltransferase-like protein (isoleucine patch superfamily) [Methanolinea mesophila]|uniref:gamma carbonic anhydrase family protein n=1 Tax=Methanolinea mesophila TaxID=547055 RepID=UPI001AEBA4B6|nr:gamma carbonic anhydrase family protein [Methanolinea mesophila]MBP1927492.1 carbonic anhydrase/acetyltransferase-like protein (isoleucine patch superfamily) [Methanolinea mesophila]